MLKSMDIIKQHQAMVVLISWVDDMWMDVLLVLLCEKDRVHDLKSLNIKIFNTELGQKSSECQKMESDHAIFQENCEYHMVAFQKFSPGLLKNKFHQKC